MMRKFLFAALLCVLPCSAWAQLGCTPQAQAVLLNQFSDLAPAGSITPQNIRNIICSIFGGDLSTSTVAATGSTTARTLAARFGEVKDLLDYGAKCDGSTDDTAAIQAWLNKAAANVALIAPAGVCNFSAALTVPSGGINQVGIVGAGPYQTVFRYTGVSTTADLLTIGDGTNSYTNWYLGNFRIASNTTMTAGTGIHFKRLSRSELRGVIADGQDGNGKLWNGIWFDAVDVVSFIGYEARGQNDGIRVNGTVGVGPKADLWLEHGKIASSAIGLHVGGAFGGILCDQSDIISNGGNVLIDTALAAEGNREVFLGPNCWIDSATVGDDILINDALAGNSTLAIGGWLSTGPANGINIQSWAGKVTVTSPTVFNFTGDAIRVQSAATVLNISSTTQIHDNAGWGVNATVATNNIFPGAEPFANSAGAYSANAHVENLASNGGYKKFNDGKIFQWFNTTFTGAANTILAPVGGNPISLPLTCPNAELEASISADTEGFANGAMQMTAVATPFGTTGVNVNLVASGTVTLAQTVRIKLWCY